MDVYQYQQGISLQNFKDPSRMLKLIDDLVISLERSDINSITDYGDDIKWDTMMIFFEIPGVIGCIFDTIDDTWQYSEEHVGCPAKVDIVSAWLLDQLATSQERQESMNWPTVIKES